MSFQRSDDLKFHNEKIHEGLVFNCEYCETYSTARKGDLRRHILLKHSEDEQKRKQTARFCKEEGCTYMNLNGTLKRHIDIKHIGIRLKCHIEDCNFGTSWANCLKRHAKVHLGEPVIDCDVEGCNVKVKNMRMHITSTHTEKTMYICKLEGCNFETHSKVYLLNHMKFKRCKLKNSESAKTKE